MPFKLNPINGQLDLVNSSSGGGGSGTMNTVKDSGVQVGGSDIVTLDFDGDYFSITESPDTEINIGLNQSGFDDLYVNLTGDETIAGVKTFSSFPITPSSAPTTDYQVANKKYVDDNGGGSLWQTSYNYLLPLTAGDGVASLVATATRSALLLQSTDGDTTNPVFGVINASYSSLTSIDATGRGSFVTTENSEVLNVGGHLNFDTVAKPATNFTATPVVAAGNLGIGAYRYATTYVTADGETETKIFSSLTTIAGSQQADLTSIAVSPDRRVTARKIYRTKVGGGSTYYLLTTIADNTTTTYTDNIADATLVTKYTISDVNDTAAKIYRGGTIAAKFDGANTSFGTGALADYTKVPRGTTAIGVNAFTNLTTGQFGVAVGESAGFTATTANNMVAIGNAAGYTNNGTDTIAIGASALRLNSTGSYNIAIGSSTGYKVTQGSNVMIGRYVMDQSTTATGNVVIGTSAGRYIGTGDNNVVIGDSAGSANAGGYSGSVLIGHDAGKNNATNNVLYIDNSDTTTPLIYGEFSGTSAGVTIHSQNTVGVPLVVKGIASQTANLQEWQDSSGTALAYIKPDGGYYAEAQAVDTTLMYLKGATSQTANLQEWEGNYGTTSIDATGQYYTDLELEDTNDAAFNVNVEGKNIPTRFYGLGMTVKQTNDVNTTTSSYGIFFEARSDATANVGTLVGGRFYCSSRGGKTNNITNSYGLQVITDIEDAALTNSAVGLEMDMADVDTGSIANSYGVRINSSVIGSGSINDQYGVYIDDIDGADADNYAIYTNAGDISLMASSSDKIGFYGSTPVVQPSAYTPSNVTTDRTYDANSTTIDEIADVLGTLIADLQSLGLVG